MFFSSSLLVVFGFANVTRITACTSKLVNNIGLRKFRGTVFVTEKTSNFYIENVTTILVFYNTYYKFACSLVVSDLSLETKGSQFESGCKLCAEESSLQ